MKVRKGWLVSLNLDTKKMIPFFVNVRSQDIVPTDPIDITAALKQTSTRWKLKRKEDRVDLTFYHYEANWDSTYDANAETVGSKLMDGYIDYYLYKDGRMEVDGIIRASGEYTAIDDNYANVVSHVYLPFAFDGIPNIRTDFGLGSCEGITTGSMVSSAVITNQKLNLNNADTSEYNFLMKLTAIVPVNGTVDSVVPLEKIRAMIETNETYSDADYLSYIRSYFPFHIHYNGFWRSEDSVKVDDAESQDDSLTGTYLTTAPVNMLTSANTKSTKVRSLATKTSLKCYGYYTETSEGKFLLCYYQATSQTGYVPIEYLSKQ